MNKTVVEPERKTPVWKECDVLVVGGGVAGIVAALAAARNGARTVLVEQSGVLGNMAAFHLPILSFFSTSGKRLTGGIPEEMVTRMKELGGCAGHTMDCGNKYSSGSVTVGDPETFECVVLQMLKEAGVDVCLHTWFAAPWMDGRIVKGAFVETKSGRMAISAKVTVDCSGDGDVAFRAGAPMTKPGGESGVVQPSTMLFTIDGVDMLRFAEASRKNPDLYRVHQKIEIVEGTDGPEARHSEELSGLEPLMVPLHAADKLGFPQSFIILARTARKGQYLVNMAKVDDVDVTDADSFSKGEMTARMRVSAVLKFLRSYVPGFENTQVVSTPPHQLGIREGRILLGEHILTVEEMDARQSYPDTVAMGGRYVDIHRCEGKVTMAERKVPKLQTFPDGYFIPYRCLVPRQVDGVLVAGRCISTTREAMGSVRVMGCVLALGQAAGVAAALSAKGNVSVKNLDIGRLQETLRKDGAIIE